MARVVDDDVNRRVKLRNELAEVLEQRDVPEVEAEHVQPCAPAAAVFLLQESLGCVHGKTCCDDEVSAASKQLEAALVADLLAAARDEGVPGARVRGV